MSIDLKDAFANYIAAWSETDAAKRLMLLEACWSDSGRYVDPNSSVVGRQDLSNLIGGFHSNMPGARIEAVSGPSHHHNRIYFRWRLITADGSVGIDGVDFGTLAEDGRLAEIVGFFGSPPEL